MNSTTTLTEFLRKHYAVYKSLTPESANAILYSIHTLEDWHGRPVLLRDLSDTLLAAWVEHETKSGKYKLRTIHGKQADILALWRFADASGVLDVGPRFIRRIKVPKRNPVAWSPADLARIFAAAAAVRGVFPNSVPKGLYLGTLMRAGYETGLRRRDLFLLRADAVSDDGTVCVVMSKTLLPHVARMREETLKGFRRLHEILAFFDSEYQEFPLHWPISMQEIYQYFSRIRKAAGVGPGALHQLRRSGATHCEAELPGSACAYLGHTTAGLAFAHYVDRRQLRKAFTPPEVEAKPAH